MDDEQAALSIVASAVELSRWAGDARARLEAIRARRLARGDADDALIVETVQELLRRTTNARMLAAEMSLGRPRWWRRLLFWLLIRS